jgi:hypothetical protein
MITGTMTTLNNRGAVLFMMSLLGTLEKYPLMVANLFMMFAPLEGWRHVKVMGGGTIGD